MDNENQEVKPNPKAMMTLPTSYVYAGAVIIAVLILALVLVLSKTSKEGKTGKTP